MTLRRTLRLREVRQAQLLEQRAAEAADQRLQEATARGVEVTEGVRALTVTSCVRRYRRPVNFGC